MRTHNARRSITPVRIGGPSPQGLALPKKEEKRCHARNGYETCCDEAILETHTRVPWSNRKAETKPDGVSNDHYRRHGLATDLGKAIDGISDGDRASHCQAENEHSETEGQTNPMDTVICSDTLENALAWH